MKLIMENWRKNLEEGFSFLDDPEEPGPNFFSEVAYGAKVNGVVNSLVQLAVILHEFADPETSPESVPTGSLKKTARRTFSLLKKDKRKLALLQEIIDDLREVAANP
tara:strand:+ start:180 stop:500 length:321 start_codon:yes stop_codon:yes gene_type:complete